MWPKQGYKGKELVKMSTPASLISLIKTCFLLASCKMVQFNTLHKKRRCMDSHLAYSFKTCQREDVPNIHVQVNKDKVSDSCIISFLLIHLIKDWRTTVFPSNHVATCSLIWTLNPLIPFQLISNYSLLIVDLPTLCITAYLPQKASFHES